MKKATKMTAMVLAMVTVCTSALTACSPQRMNSDDGNKSKLIVNNYAGGFGEDWINNVEKRFEEAYADVSFEDGKTGVDVVINHNKDQGESYISKIDAMEDEVFFPGNIYYHEWIASGKMLDITDVISEANAEDGGKSILDKMTQEEKDFYSVDGKYYAIPHHESQPGIVYDRDLFEAKGLYFAKNGAPSEDYAMDKAAAGGYSGTTAYTGKGEKSAGPDGQHGTSDDGLPATYEEMFILCKYMQEPSVGVTPFVWTGKTKGYYTDLLLAALTADYEGAEQLAMQYSYTGTAKNLISISGSGAVTELPEKEITVDNGYEMYSSAGRYYALKFLETIIDNNYYSESCFGSRTHLEVQADFMKTTKTKENAVAFLVEGNWWENEAGGSFEELEKYYPDGGYAKTDRNFAFLPLPKATNEQIGEGVTMTTTEVSLGFIKSSISEEKIELAKTFLKFCYTDESLNEFTQTTGLPAALQYELEQDIYDGLSAFGKSVCDVKNTVVKPYGNNDIFKNNYQSYILMFTFATPSYKYACDGIKDYSASAEDLFRMIATNRQAGDWGK